MFVLGDRDGEVVVGLFGDGGKCSGWTATRRGDGEEAEI